jgi:hypothetical protein
MIHRFGFVAIIATIGIMTGCDGSARADRALGEESAMVTLNHGYALLYATISDDADVDKVLIIKSPSMETKEIIKAIGELCRSAKGMLETLAKETPALVFADQGLPQSEMRTRKAISSATSKQILFSGGKELEFRLLLTQHEALNYITHLAGELRDQEPRDSRKRYLAKLAKDAAALHDRVLAALSGPYVDRPK